MSARRLSRHSLPAAGRGAAVCRSLDSGLTTYGDAPTPGDGPAPIEAVRDGPCLAPGTAVVTRVFLAIIVGVLPAIASAQETRSESIAAEQAEKAKNLAPPTQHWSEALLLRFQQGLVQQPGGFFPYFDSVYSGGGFTLGGGYRHFTGDRTHVSLAGLYSAKGYKLVEAAATSPGHLSGHLDLGGTASWRDATQVAYHGLGIDSPADIDTAFRMQQAIVGGDATLRLHRWVRLTAATAYEDYTLEDPTGSNVPVDDVFTPATAPGLGVNPAYLHTTVSAAFDWRRAEDYARRGGLYRLVRHQYSDQDSTYSFDRLEAEVVQHIPIVRENWVVSLRGRLETTLDDEDQVPYFLLPALGSGSTLRAYSSWRFRDRHAMLMSGEWRWIPSRVALDMAFFYDTGMVAPRLDAIALNRFVHDFGVGMRFHAPARTALRVEVARGSEGLHLVFAAGAAF